MLGEPGTDEGGLERGVPPQVEMKDRLSRQESQRAKQTRNAQKGPIGQTTYTLPRGILATRLSRRLALPIFSPGAAAADAANYHRVEYGAREVAARAGDAWRAMSAAVW